MDSDRLWGGLAAAAILAFAPNASGWFNSEKAWELTLQFLFVAVLGSVVAYFFHEMENRRAEELQKQERSRKRMEARRSALEMGCAARKR